MASFFNQTIIMSVQVALYLALWMAIIGCLFYALNLIDKSKLTHKNYIEFALIVATICTIFGSIYMLSYSVVRDELSLKNHGIKTTDIDFKTIKNLKSRYDGEDGLKTFVNDNNARNAHYSELHSLSSVVNNVSKIWEKDLINMRELSEKAREHSFEYAKIIIDMVLLQLQFNELNGSMKKLEKKIPKNNEIEECKKKLKFTDITIAATHINILFNRDDDVYHFYTKLETSDLKSLLKEISSIKSNAKMAMDKSRNVLVDRETIFLENDMIQCEKIVEILIKSISDYQSVINSGEKIEQQLLDISIKLEQMFIPKYVDVFETTISVNDCKCKGECFQKSHSVECKCTSECDQKNKNENQIQSEILQEEQEEQEEQEGEESEEEKQENFDDLDNYEHFGSDQNENTKQIYEKLEEIELPSSNDPIITRNEVAYRYYHLNPQYSHFIQDRPKAMACQVDKTNNWENNDDTANTKTNIISTCVYSDNSKNDPNIWNRDQCVNVCNNMVDKV
jgi:hypothetical protein